MTTANALVSEVVTRQDAAREKARERYSHLLTAGKASDAAELAKLMGVLEKTPEALAADQQAAELAPKLQAAVDGRPRIAREATRSIKEMAEFMEDRARVRTEQDRRMGQLHQAQAMHAQDNEASLVAERDLAVLKRRHPDVFADAPPPTVPTHRQPKVRTNLDRVRELVADGNAPSTPEIEQILAAAGKA